jgi:hypothetical protein
MRSKLPAFRPLAGAFLIAVMALAAFAAAPAPAATCHLHLYGETCESEREHAEFLAFANCPFGAAEELDCSWALSSAKEMWPSTKAKEEWEAERGRKPPELPSEMKAGNVTVLLRQAITLRGGIGFFPEEAEQWFGAVGVPTIQPVAEVAAPLTKDVNTSMLSESELNRYDYYVHVAKETRVTATVELAGPASSIQVNAINLLSESGPAFTFPVRLHLNSPFVGGECYVGSEAEPVVVAFTTGISGALQGKNGSTIKTDRHGFILSVLTDTLVNNEFASPGVQGCGVEGGADAAIDSALGLPSPPGNNLAVLNGTLKLAGAENAKLGLEGTI